jgi:glycosyltransferase involved in cell wall biosynthesis
MTVNILHLHSTFALGGKEARAVRLMNAFGDRARHTIVSGMPDQLGARDAIDKGIRYEIAQNPPPLTGNPSVKRFEAIARYMAKFDLVLTYNWGAIDGVMAKRVFGVTNNGGGMPPVIHHEDGFNADEAKRLNPVRNMYRRVALGAAYGLVVPSRTLERIALKTWKQPAGRLHRIANGIPVHRYAGLPEPKAIPGFVRQKGEVIVGTIAGMREVKDLPMLVRAMGGMIARSRLVIAGDGPERETIADTAANMGLEKQVLLPGFLPDPSRYVRHFDIFALSSKSEQAPISVIEAMAAGLPVVAPPVGDVAQMVSDENRPYLSPDWNEVHLRDCIQALAADPASRKRVGEANRKKARALFDEGAMIAAYAKLYAAALGKPGILG